MLLAFQNPKTKNKKTL